MSSQSPSSSTDQTQTQTTPLLPNPRQFTQTPSLRGAARFLRRASSRRMLREPSMRVRESAAEQIEERQSDWAYSRPVVILDLIWNFAFIVVSLSVLFMSRNEDPKRPLRVWIVGYGFQCLLHMVCVVVEFKHRMVQQRGSESGSSASAGEGSAGGEGREYGDLGPHRLHNNEDDDTSPVSFLYSLDDWNDTEECGYYRKQNKHLEACTHPFFDELRDPTTTLPDGKPLPPLFNFTQQELAHASPELLQRLIPEQARK